MKLPRCTFLHLAAGAAALPPFAHRASAVLSYAAGAAHYRRFPGGGAAMSPFSQQLMYRGREHEPFPPSFAIQPRGQRGER
jgi:hypothetical protein